MTGRSLSESQSRALYERETPYTEAHRSSWSVRFDRPTHEPTSLRGYVNELRDAYQSEVPTRLHSRDLDSGGAPDFTAAFEAYLWGSPFTIDQESGAYASPFRACLAGMNRSEDERTRRRAAIAGRTVVGGVSAVEAAIAEGVPSWCASIVAADALRVTWHRLTSGPLPLPKRDAVA